ncbi:RagB/SusD family nutrient uptake outer membrane protein [Fulvivirgaceae bacterium BMA12]|uniref:RagB/SusD family nutrient uptake outer membrane protein n=1 Tax=Agaribacillus aureus TaxID=3051825 RepID=A0ABT8L9B4_9BACT|nr:RagB/SusD family nutrient uptake outer membrane protein [Fulvivirgaceae bacterium BMA12]
MKNIRLSILVSLTLTLLMVASCDDILEQEPINTISQKQFWRNNNDAQLAVTSIYSILRNSISGLNRTDVPSSARGSAWGDYMIYGDARSGDWVNPADNDSDWKNIIANNLRAFPTLRDLHNWRLFYRVIEQCNLVIENVPGIQFDITEEQKKLALAHAFFVRGFVYFYMVRIWGDVPLNLEAENIEPLPRTDQTIVLRQAVEDLTKAETDLPEEYFLDGVQDKCLTKTRGTKGSANAVLAHTYMWLGEYANAVAVIDKIQKSNVYRLLPTEEFRALFDDGCSDEGIFELFYSFEAGESLGYYGSSVNWFFVRPFTNRENGSFGIPKTKILETFTYPNDKRLAEFFLSIGPPPLYEFNTDPLANDENKIMFAKYRKAPNFTAEYDNNVMLFRYGGILLLRAEASAQLGDVGDALTHLNMVRQRAGIIDYTSTDPQQILAEVLQERRRELTGESHRFYDLMRNNLVHEFTGFISEDDIKKGGALWPVADEAFLNNPGMTQNIFWE